MAERTRVEWVPPDLAREGVTPRLLEVLLDAEREPAKRLLPGPCMSVVYDQAYTDGLARKLLVLQREVAWMASLSDPLVLTEAGIELITRYRDAVTRLGT